MSQFEGHNINAGILLNRGHKQGMTFLQELWNRGTTLQNKGR